MKEKTADYLDPPRDYPLIGPGQMHHTHYKCTIYSRASDGSERQEVIYVDHHHIRQLPAKAASSDQQATTTSAPLNQRKLVAKARYLRLQLARQNAILDDLKTSHAKSLEPQHARDLDSVQLEHDIRQAEHRIKMFTLDLEGTTTLLSHLKATNGWLNWRKANGQRPVDNDAFAAVFQANGDEPSPPSKRVAELEAEVAAAEQAFNAVREKLSDAEFQTQREAFKKKRLSAFNEALEIVQADPASPGGFAALVWLLRTPQAQNFAGFPTVLSLMIEHHAANPAIGKGLAVLAFYLPEWLPDVPIDEPAAELFQAVIEKNRDKTVRGHAVLGQAKLSRKKYVRANLHGAADANKLEALAEEQLQAVIRDYGDCQNLREPGAQAVFSHAARRGRGRAVRIATSEGRQAGAGNRR